MIQYLTVVNWDVNLADVGFADADNKNLAGLAIFALQLVAGAPTATVGQWLPGAMVHNVVDGNVYQMTGTTAAPVWALMENAGLILTNQMVYNSVATSGATVITAAQTVDAILDRNQGATDSTDTTATATAMLALIPGAIVNSSFVFKIRNVSATVGEKMTLLAGSGVTISGSAVIFSGSSADFVGIVTNATTAAITLYRVGKWGLVDFEDVPSSVNTLGFTTSVTGAAPIIKAIGSDSNIGLNLTPKGTGAVGTASPIRLAQVPNYIATEGGANNAITGALLDANGVAVPLAAGLEVVVKLAHTLQAGANTFNFNGGGAVAIKSHFNVATDIATAYAATGVIRLQYSGAAWFDMSQ